jgi:hypothetical protein
LAWGRAVGAVPLPFVSAQRRMFRVYVDEAGDRGWGGAASEVFVLTAVVVPDDQDAELRSTLDKINADMGRQQKRTLHWAENVREHCDRKYVARQLADLPATFMTVTVCKPSLIGTGSALNKPDYQYNYPMRRLLERVSWYVDQQRGQAHLTLAHVRRFKYESLHNYLGYLRLEPGCSIRWAALKNGTRPVIEQPNKIRGLQVADLVAGCVFSAVRSDRHGAVEPAYLETIYPRLWQGRTQKLQTYGLHFICGPGHQCADHYDWLPKLGQS